MMSANVAEKMIKGDPLEVGAGGTLAAVAAMDGIKSAAGSAESGGKLAAEAAVDDIPLCKIQNTLCKIQNIHSSPYSLLLCVIYQSPSSNPNLNSCNNHTLCKIQNIRICSRKCWTRNLCLKSMHAAQGGEQYYVSSCTQIDEHSADFEVSNLRGHHQGISVGASTILRSSLENYTTLLAY